MAVNPQDVPDPLEGIVIPPKPQILVDITMAGDNPEEIIHCIEQDIGISASVLKSINSPYYNLRVTVTSIEKAVMLLGLKTVTNLVDRLALHNCLSAEQQASMEGFWDSSSDAAKAAAVIAEQTKLITRDKAYTLGLFHNCGIPLLMQKHPDYMAIVHKAYADPECNHVKLERDEIKLDHAYVGYKLCQMWNLHENVCQTIRLHHHGKAFLTSSKIGQDVKVMGAVLMFAEHVAEICRTLGGQDTDHAWPLVADTVMDILKLNDDRYEDIREIVQETAYV